MARVLVMDDDLKLRLQLEAALTHAGHDVDCVGSPNDALAALEDGRYDIMVSDLYIPPDVPDGYIYVVKPATVPRGGISLIRKIRRLGRAPGSEWLGQMPIIAISGAAARAGHLHALPAAQAVGATHVMDKPFTDEELVHAVAQMVA